MRIASCRAAAAALAVAACGSSQPTTLDVPGHRLDPSAVDAAASGFVRAYLRAFKLDEKTLPPGLAVPWAAGAEWGVVVSTGAIGPGGHQTYEIHELGVASGGVTEQRRRVEIAPEGP